MKRRRSSAPGMVRPDVLWPRSILLGVLLLVVAACGEASSTGQPTDESPSPSTVTDPPEPLATEPTREPPPGETPTTTSEPSTPAPTDTPPAAPASEAPAPGTAASCSGSDENRDFFASMAAAVDWTVYCPVLGDGWFVDDGRYRLAGGGWLEIGYDGPGDTRLILRQGAFCTAADGCVPSGGEAGPVGFGDRTGSLIVGGDGTLSVIVDRGSKLSWLLVVNGLDEAAVRRIAADMHAVAG